MAYTTITMSFGHTGVIHFQKVREDFRTPSVIQVSDKA